MDYQENILRNLRVNLNKVGASLVEQKCHQRYYINVPISAYLSFNLQEQLAIDEAGSQSMEPKRYRRVLSIFKSRYLKYLKYIESNRTFELSISNEMWQYVFRSVVRSYIFTFYWVRTWFIFCFFSYVAIIHSLRRGGGVGIYCPLILDWIESIQAQILFYLQIQNGDTEPNSKCYLKEYFDIAYSNTLNLFRFFDCDCILVL